MSEADDFYQELADDAEELILEYGRTINIVSESKSGSSFNPTITNSPVSAKGIFTEFTKEEKSSESIILGDKKLLLAYSQDISEHDRIQDGSKSYSIVKINEIMPGNVGIVYKIQVRL